MDVLATADKERILRLEARITSHGTQSGAVTSVGFDAPLVKIPRESSRPALNRSNSSKSEKGAAGAPMRVPDSPDVRQETFDNNSAVGQSLEVEMERASNESAWSATQEGTEMISRKRKLAPAPSENPLRFSREEDGSIMHTVFFERSETAWQDLSIKLNRSEEDIKQRYKELVSDAARLETEGTTSNNNNNNNGSGNEGGLSRTNSISRSALSVNSILNENDSRGESTPGKGKARASATSPGTGTSVSLKNALKNQPQIKQFFVPIANGPVSSEKRKKLGHRRSSGKLSQQLFPPVPTGSTILGVGDSAVNDLSQQEITDTKEVSLDGTIQASESCTGEGVTNKSKGGLLEHFSSASNLSVGSATIGIGNTSSNNRSRSSPFQPARSSEVREMELLVRDREREIQRLQKSLEDQTETLQREKHCSELLKMECDELRSKSTKLERDQEERKDRVAKVLEELLRKTDSELHRFQRKRLTEESYRLGRISVQKHGFGPRARLAEVWEEGEAFRSIRSKQLDLLQRREELEKKKKVASKVWKQRKATTGSFDDAQFSELEEMVTEESIKAEVNSLKRREQDLADERTKLDIEKVFHIRNFKRIREEDGSRFNRQPVLNNRYLLRELLGKGGFSEVWKAYDLIELRDVAVKVHELNSNWSEEKKANYLKHATREYNIHLSLVHPRIVQLFDVFEIDPNSFATVLEYCKGTDLEVHLKLRKTLPEREARSVLLQILSGLRYLSSGGEMGGDEGGEEVFDGPGSAVCSDPKRKSQRPCIIHYDLKPGNILFDGSGGVKITDFGLSKIMEPADAESTGIELTSQGAGTYWYLPPECFRTGGAPPKISSKVDVWSTGVIFFQMLFGARPFGEGMSQERLYQDQTMLKATQVSFPSKPPISNEAKEFIRRCLTYNQEYRPDVKTICQDPYLRQKKI